MATAEEIRQEAAKVHEEAEALHRAAAEAAEHSFDASAKAATDHAAEMLAKAEKLEQEAVKLDAKANATGATNDRNMAQYDRAIAQGDSVRAAHDEEQGRQQADKAAGLRREVESNDVPGAIRVGTPLDTAAEALDTKAHLLDTAASDQSAADGTSGAASAKHHADADAALHKAEGMHVDFTGIDADTLLHAGIPRSEIPGDELMNPADDASYPAPHHPPPISDEIPGYPGYQDYQEQVLPEEYGG